jgi:glutaredoxin
MHPSTTAVRLLRLFMLVMGISSSVHQRRGKTSTADRMATEERVKALIAGNKVMVFSKSYCPYCTKAKKALSQFTSDFTVLEVRFACHRTRCDPKLASTTNELGVSFCIWDKSFLVLCRSFLCQTMGDKNLSTRGHNANTFLRSAGTLKTLRKLRLYFDVSYSIALILLSSTGVEFEVICRTR